jgi:2-hydroxy-3-keto-5-methylthiopentenyl-1-phosphate phosphatase
MSTLISDFDGTVTRYDFFERVRKRWPFPPEDDPWEKFVAGQITHFQALAEIFGRIRTSEADLHLFERWSQIADRLQKVEC